MKCTLRALDDEHPPSSYDNDTKLSTTRGIARSAGGAGAAGWGGGGGMMLHAELGTKRARDMVMYSQSGIGYYTYIYQYTSSHTSHPPA